MSAKGVLDSRVCCLAMTLAINMGMDPNKLDFDTPVSTISEEQAKSVLARRARCMATEMEIDMASRRR